VLHRETVFDGCRGDVSIEPVLVPAIIFHATLLPESLGDVPAAFFVLGEGNGFASIGSAATARSSNQDRA